MFIRGRCEGSCPLTNDPCLKLLYISALYNVSGSDRGAPGNFDVAVLASLLVIPLHISISHFILRKRIPVCDMKDYCVVTISQDRNYVYFLAIQMCTFLDARSRHKLSNMDHLLRTCKVLNFDHHITLPSYARSPRYIGSFQSTIGGRLSLRSTFFNSRESHALNNIGRASHRSYNMNISLGIKTSLQIRSRQPSTEFYNI